LRRYVLPSRAGQASLNIVSSVAKLILSFTGSRLGARTAQTMVRDHESVITGSMDLPRQPIEPTPRAGSDAPRMQYRSRPVSVAVDPISLVISECISITSAIHKHARSPHSSVSAILGGNPNPIHLGPPTPRLGARSKSPSGSTDAESESGITNRWGLRGQKGKSVLDNPLIAGFGKLRLELARTKGATTFMEREEVSQEAED
jgi:hypothetical protein